MKEQNEGNIENFKRIYDQVYTNNEEARKKRLSEWIKGLERKAMDYSNEDATVIYQEIKNNKKVSIEFKKLASYYEEEQAETKIFENRNR